MLPYLMNNADNNTISENDLTRAYLYAANVHLMYLDYGSAMKFYRMGYEHCCNGNDVDMQASFLHNMTVTSCYLRNIPDAKRYNTEMKKLSVKNKWQQQQDYHMGLGYISREEGNWDKVIDEMKQSLYINKSHDLDDRYRASALSEIYTAFEQKEELDSALKYLRPYLNLSLHHSLTPMTLDAYRAFARIFETKHCPDSAARYRDLYARLLEASPSSQDFLMAKSDYADYETKKATNEISSLRITISKQKLTVICISLILAIAVSIGSIIYIQKRKLTKTYRELFRRNQELTLIEKRSRELAMGKTSAPCPKTEKARHESAVILYNRIVEFLNSSEGFLDPDFSIGSLAKALGSNTKYVSEAINQIGGTSFRELLNRMRIQKVREMLLDGNADTLTLKAISEQVGFRSPTTFFSAFKKATGLTPSQYIRMAKEKTEPNNPTDSKQPI